MTPRFLAVTLVVSDGPGMGPHRMLLALRLSGVVLPDRIRAGGSVARRDRGILDLEPDGDAFRRLCGAAEAAGFVERAPRVEAKVDTSDRSSIVLLHVAHDQGSWTLQLGLMGSGFVGPDAAALHRFFEILLEIADVREPGPRRDLAGLD